MSRVLRPRRHGPPSDHTYSACIPGVPVYDLQVTPIITGLTRPSLDSSEAHETHTKYDCDTEPSDPLDTAAPPPAVENVETVTKKKAVASTVKADVQNNANPVSCTSRKKRRKRKAYYDFGLNPPRKKCKRTPRKLATPSATSPAPSTGDPPTGDAAAPESFFTMYDGAANQSSPLKSATEARPAADGPGDEVCLPPAGSVSVETSSLVSAFGVSSTPTGSRKCSKGKSLCCACSKQCSKLVKGGDTADRRQSERIYMKNYKLPFSELPPECKLMVLSCLTPCERALTATVCKEWEQLIKLSSMWSQVDLTIFNFVPIQPRFVPFSRQICSRYHEQLDRTVKYMEYLTAVKPTMKSLRFKFDICPRREDWLGKLYELFDSSRRSGCGETAPVGAAAGTAGTTAPGTAGGVTMLTKLTCDWTVTPMEPNTEQFCCIFNKIRTMFRRHLERVKLFHEMLSRVTRIAPKLEHVHFPFDWSPRSVLLLSRLRHLKVLKLGKYLSPHGVSQLNLDCLMAGLPQLQHLEMAICVPLFSSRTLYQISHPRLQVLDLAYCQGFYLQRVNLPELVHIKLLRHYWRGSVVSARENSIPCLYTLLCEGAPKVTRMNKHKLPSFWTEFLYDELDHLLHRVCSCKVHLCKIT